MGNDGDKQHFRLEDLKFLINETHDFPDYITVSDVKKNYKSNEKLDKHRNMMKELEKIDKFLNSDLYKVLFSKKLNVSNELKKTIQHLWEKPSCVISQVYQLEWVYHQTRNNDKNHNSNLCFNRLCPCKTIAAELNKTFNLHDDKSMSLEMIINLILDAIPELISRKMTPCPMLTTMENFLKT
jgi:hypothetical protein